MPFGGWAGEVAAPSEPRPQPAPEPAWPPPPWSVNAPDEPEAEPQPEPAKPERSEAVEPESVEVDEAKPVEPQPLPPPETSGKNVPMKETSGYSATTRVCMLDWLAHWIAVTVGVLLLGEVHAVGGASFQQQCFGRVVGDRRITAVGAPFGITESYEADVARMRLAAVVARVVS